MGFLGHVIFGVLHVVALGWLPVALFLTVPLHLVFASLLQRRAAQHDDAGGPVNLALGIAFIVVLGLLAKCIDGL